MKRALIAMACAVCMALSAACDAYAVAPAETTAQIGDATDAGPDTPFTTPGPSLSPAATPAVTAADTAAPAGDIVVVPAQSGTAPARPQASPTVSSVPAMAAAPGVNTTISAEAAKFADLSGKTYDSVRFSSNRYKYTQEELKMLAIVIRTEVGHESYRAKLAVANVVMNRVLARGYPGATIKEVILRPNQFAYWPRVIPTADCYRAAHDVLDREVWVVPQNTYFFRATRSKSNWGSHKYWGHIGATAFYRDSYAGRYNGSQIPAGLYERVYKWPQYGCKPASRVRKIQKMLGALGYDVPADGYFGLNTRKALIKFQQDTRLAADGVAGPATLRALIGKYGLSKYLKL